MTFPPGLQLFICPDLRAAANDVLADVDALHPGPFDVPSVSVRHPSVRRYLTLELARRHGIAASVRFPAPQDLIDTLIGKPRRDPWDREALAWQIAAIIPEIAEQLPEGLAHALTEGDLLVRLDFARRLSTRLRDAMLHRPAMVEAWERGERYLAAVDDEVWYAELWRRLSKQLDAPSPIARFSNWRDGGAEVPKDPILLVGDATLPPLHREVLRLASQHTAVRWYIVDCNTPAFDPERPRRRPAALAALKALDNATITTVPAAHTSPPATSLLGRVQRALSGHFDAPVALAPDDRSVVAHRCHSAVREIESLREQLVRRLAEDASLQPHDAVLYVTDLETYLPAIDAVFGVPDDGLLRIPYEVAGRPWRSRAPIGAAVAALLHALAGRFGRSEILGLLEHPAIRQRAGFGFGDLGAIRNLVESVGIHWGVDGAHREARFDLPPEEGATWREGLSRLHQQRVPASDALEPDNTTTQIDRLTAWFERLASAEAIVATPHSIAEWRVIVDALISDFLTTWSSDDAEVLSGLRRSIEHLVTSSAAARIDATLPLAAIGQELEHILTETATSGDLRGGLRICALTPGMVLPARVVMIAGLDDALFPRGGGVPTWDILLQSRLDNDHDPLEAEDPDPREDALDAFRDAVRSASDALHISWVGRSMMDNAERAPSVAVSELLDIVGQVADNAPIVINEPLQPFAEELFTAGAVNQSGSRRWADVATALQAPAVPSQFASPLPETTVTTIRLDDLADAMRDPIKWHWTRVLALPTPGSEADDEDTEPVLNEDHDDFGLNRALLDLARSNTPITAEAVRSRTAAGLGAIADVAIAAQILPAAAALEAAANQPASRIVPVRLDLGGYTIEGSLDRVSTEGQSLIIWWPSSARSLLGEWVRHLALCAVAPEGVDLRTRVVGVGRKPEQLHAEFRSVSNAREILGTLCGLYATLSANAIPAFPRSAFKYAVAKLKDKDAAKAAYDCWAGGYMSDGEGEDAIASRLFPERVLDEDRDPEFWLAFTQYADAVAVPMVAHLDSVLMQ